MDTQELKYWIAFNRIPRIGRVRFGLMEQHFGSLSEAWPAGLPDLLAAGIDDKTARLIVTRRPKIDPDAEIKRVSDWAPGPSPGMTTTTLPGSRRSTTRPQCCT